MSTYQYYLQSYTRGFLGFSTLSVMIQSCLGGLAAMAILMNGNSPLQMYQLFVAVVLCVGYNGALLSQQTAKTSFNLLLVSIFVNATLFIVNCFY
ncbi:hypothetical protein ACLI1A_03095 [Flavobacterium sp. RHBU_3]|uniref:hypothetical protein n=1 Tax=Flavobacterium sp. RHBU_3 TaxID=3391184 RepID=UPI00398521AE